MSLHQPPVRNCIAPQTRRRDCDIDYALIRKSFAEIGGIHYTAPERNATPDTLILKWNFPDL